ASARRHRGRERGGLLRAALPLRLLDVRGAVRPRLGSVGGVRVAALLLRPVGPDGLGLDVRLRRSLGLGGIPLRPLELWRGGRLVLGPRPRLGPGLGELALWGGLRDVVPAGSPGGRLRIPPSRLGCRLRAALHPSDRRRGGARAAHVWRRDASPASRRPECDCRPWRELRTAGNGRGAGDGPADPADRGSAGSPAAARRYPGRECLVRRGDAVAARPTAPGPRGRASGSAAGGTGPASQSARAARRSRAALEPWR